MLNTLPKVEAESKIAPMMRRVSVSPASDPGQSLTGNILPSAIESEERKSKCLDPLRYRRRSEGQGTTLRWALVMFWILLVCFASEHVSHAATVAATSTAAADDAGPSSTPLRHTLNYVSLRAPGSHDLVVAMDPGFYGNLSLTRYYFLINRGRPTQVREYQQVEIDDSFLETEGLADQASSSNEYITTVRDGECVVQDIFFFQPGPRLSSGVIIVMQNKDRATRLIKLTLRASTIKPPTVEPYKFVVTGNVSVEEYHCGFQELMPQIISLAMKK